MNYIPLLNYILPHCPTFQ